MPTHPYIILTVPQNFPEIFLPPKTLYTLQKKKPHTRKCTFLLIFQRLEMVLEFRINCRRLDEKINLIKIYTLLKLE